MNFHHSKITKRMIKIHVRVKRFHGFENFGIALLLINYKILNT